MRVFEFMRTSVKHEKRLVAQGWKVVAYIEHSAGLGMAVILQRKVKR